MSLATMLLSVVAVLIFFGLLQRVLDRMYLSDRGALLLIACMFAGTLMPNLRLGRVEINIGGALIPLCVCLYLLVRAKTSQERVRAAACSVLTAAAIFLIGRLLPDEPETLPIEPMVLYGLCAALIASILGRSRRSAFIGGILGMLFADTANAFEAWSHGIDQPLVLGGAGLADAVVISGITAVLITELVGEIYEKIANKSKKVGEKKHS